MPPPAPNYWEVTKALVLRGARLAATPRVSVLAAERLRHQRWGPGLKESPRSVFPGMAADHRLHDGLGSFFKVQIPGPSPGIQIRRLRGDLEESQFFALTLQEICLRIAHGLHGFYSM